MKRIGWVLTMVVFALVLLLGGALIGYRGWGDQPWGMVRGYGMMGGYGFPMMGFMGGLGMLLFWGLVIGGIVWLVVAASRGHEPTLTPTSSSDTPLDILKRRYAAGEINQEQFDEMKRNL